MGSSIFFCIFVTVSIVLLHLPEEDSNQTRPVLQDFHACGSYQHCRICRTEGIDTINKARPLRYRVLQEEVSSALDYKIAYRIRTTTLSTNLETDEFVSQGPALQCTMFRAIDMSGHQML